MTNAKADELSSNVELFADDTSLFFVVHNLSSSSAALNTNSSKIILSAQQWKMSFIPVPGKQAQGVIFSRNVNKYISSFDIQ